MGQIGRVTGQEYRKNRTTDKDVSVLQTEITDPSDIQSAELISQTGEESNPPVGSRVILVKVGEAFKIAIASDDSIVPSVAPGEKKIYSTNEDGDTVQAYILLQNDGTIKAENQNVTITASPTGELTITTTGQTTVNSSKVVFNSSVDINGILSIIQGGVTSTMDSNGLSLGTGQVISGPDVFNGPDSDDHRHDTTTNPSGVPE